MERLGCTEKQLYEEYSVETIAQFETYFEIQRKVEEIEEQKAKTEARIPAPRSPHFPRGGLR